MIQDVIGLNTEGKLPSFPVKRNRLDEAEVSVDVVRSAKNRNGLFWRDTGGKAELCSCQAL